MSAMFLVIEIAAGVAVGIIVAAVIIVIAIEKMQQSLRKSSTRRILVRRGTQNRGAYGGYE
jgi:hypothetical protein